MATKKLTEKPETESVGSEDKLVLVQGGALRLAKVSEVRQEINVVDVTESGDSSVENMDLSAFKPGDIILLVGDAGVSS